MTRFTLYRSALVFATVAGVAIGLARRLAPDGVADPICLNGSCFGPLTLTGDAAFSVANGGTGTTSITTHGAKLADDSCAVVVADGTCLPDCSTVDAGTMCSIRLQSLGFGGLEAGGER